MVLSQYCFNITDVSVTYTTDVSVCDPEYGHNH